MVLFVNKFVNHACQGTYACKQRRTFCIFRLLNIHVQTGSNYPVQPGLHILLSGFHNPQGKDICSSFLSIPSGSLSFINVLICLPVLIPHLDHFPPFADLVAAKLLALTLMQPHEGKDRTCQATVRQTRPNL